MPPPPLFGGGVSIKEEIYGFWTAKWEVGEKLWRGDDIWDIRHGDIV